MSLLPLIAQAFRIAAHWFINGRQQASAGHPVIEVLKSASGGGYAAVTMLLLIPLAPDPVVRATGGLFLLTACSLVALQVMRHVRSDELRLTAAISHLMICMLMSLACVSTVASHSPSRMLGIVCGVFMLVTGALLVRGLSGFEPTSNN